MDTSSTTTPARLRIKMPAEVFVKIWKGEMAVKGTKWARKIWLDETPNQISMSDIEVQEDIQVTLHDNSLLSLVLFNCEISNFIFINANIQSIYIYENSRIKNIRIQNSNAGNFEVGDSIIERILIQKKSILGGFGIQNSTIGEFILARNSTTDAFEITNSQINRFWVGDSTTRFFSIINSKIDSISIINANTDSFKIEKNSVLGDFNIEKSKVGTFEIITSKTGRFKIEDSTTESFSILAESITGSFEIINSFTKDFLIQKRSITKTFWFKNSTAGLFKIEHSKTTLLSFKENSRVSKVRIWYGEIQRIQVRSESHIGLLRCNFNLQGPVHIILAQSSFEHIDFHNSVLSEFTTLSVLDCKVNRLTLNNTCNYGTVFFSRLLPLKKWEDFKRDENSIPVYESGIPQFESRSNQSTLCLSDSDLGKMQFINCDLRNFDRFEFTNTKMLDVFVAGSEMPGNNSFCLPEDEKNLLKIAEQKRLAYGQFKRIYETQGDLAGSLRYLSYEMDAYREQLMQEKTRPRFSKKWWIEKKSWDNRGERVTLWLNKISTNYGNNWLRGLIMTLLMMSICFAIFCWMLGYRLGNNWEKFGELVSYAPYYLNPLRDLDSVSMINENKDVPVEWYARLWDFFSRIIVAYFAYQTIQAFRKLGKSSG